MKSLLTVPSSFWRRGEKEYKRRRRGKERRRRGESRRGVEGKEGRGVGDEARKRRRRRGKTNKMYNLSIVYRVFHVTTHVGQKSTSKVNKVPTEFDVENPH